MTKCKCGHEYFELDEGALHENSGRAYCGEFIRKCNDCGIDIMCECMYPQPAEEMKE